MEEQNILVEKRKSPNFKIIIAAVATIIILAIVLSIIFASPIPKDYKKLRQNLRDEDYYVVSSTNRDEILEGLEKVMLEGIFYYEDEGLEDELYKLIDKSGFNEHELIELSKSIDCFIWATDGYYENYMISLYFEDKSSAEEFYSLFKPLLDFVKENGSDSDMFENIKRSDFTFGQKGKVMYIGTKDALKASK